MDTEESDVLNPERSGEPQLQTFWQGRKLRHQTAKQGRPAFLQFLADAPGASMAGLNEDNYKRVFGLQLAPGNLAVDPHKRYLFETGVFGILEVRGQIYQC